MVNALLEPFDLYALFVQTLSGNEWIFAILSVMVIGAMGAKFKFPNVMVGFFILLYGIIMGAFIGWFAIIPIIVFGMVAYSIIGRVVKS